MDKDLAIHILVALACCSIPQLLCYDCPLYDAPNNKCRPWSEEEVAEAVRTLNREQEDENG